jgi:hypothetical protein
MIAFSRTLTLLHRADVTEFIEPTDSPRHGSCALSIDARLSSMSEQDLNNNRTHPAATRGYVRSVTAEALRAGRFLISRGHSGRDGVQDNEQAQEAACSSKEPADHEHRNYLRVRKIGVAHLTMLGQQMGRLLNLLLNLPTNRWIHDSE